jgi:hypothetical protein
VFGVVASHATLNLNQIMDFLNDMALLQQGQDGQDLTEAAPF